MEVTWTGIGSAAARVRDIAPTIRRNTVKAMNMEGEAILTDSKQNYVPVDEGTLRNTGHVQHARHKPAGDIEVVIRYGPLITAIVIHELPDFNPPSWRSGVQFKRGGPKYLEIPLNLAVSGMAERIA